MVYRLEAADHLYREAADLSEDAVSKTQQTYSDALRTLTDVESLQLPTATNMSAVQLAADDIKQQVWLFFCSSDNCVNNINYSVVVLKCSCTQHHVNPGELN